MQTLQCAQACAHHGTAASLWNFHRWVLEFKVMCVSSVRESGGGEGRRGGGSRQENSAENRWLCNVGGRVVSERGQKITGAEGMLVLAFSGEPVLCVDVMWKVFVLDNKAHDEKLVAFVRSCQQVFRFLVKAENRSYPLAWLKYNSVSCI